MTIHAKLLYTLEAVKEAEVDTLISTTHAYCSSLNVICWLANFPTSERYLIPFCRP